MTKFLSNIEFKTSSVIAACDDCLKDIYVAREVGSRSILVDSKFLIFSSKFPFIHIRKLTDSEIDKYIKDQCFDKILVISFLDEISDYNYIRKYKWSMRESLCISLKDMAYKSHSDCINITLEDYEYISSYIKKE